MKTHDNSPSPKISTNNQKYASDHFATILVLDTTAQNRTAVAVIHRGSVRRVVRDCRAQELQLMISQFLATATLDWPDIKAIAVLTGPGSFTGIRIGIASANTLHWLYRCPLIEVPSENLDEAVEQLQAGEEFTVTRYLVPRD